MEGQLRDFNLAEILQLIAGQQKSGFLNLETVPSMIFIFEKGNLVSTRDRRSRTSDPLEAYLRTYGFLDESQWQHVQYVKGNSSLDLTEILISERLCDEEQLTRILQGLAQEMVCTGMKLKQGRYKFQATHTIPPGVRGRIMIDVQGLLMEAARRIDEEPLLAELLPSPHTTFKPGSRTITPDALGATRQRLASLALAGKPLEVIIGQARADAFTTRQLLRELCEEGYLVPVVPESVAATAAKDQSAVRAPGPRVRLRARVALVAVALVMVGLGSWRWRPVLHPEGEVSEVTSAARAADPAAVVGGQTSASGGDVTAVGSSADRQLRLQQIHDEVEEAISLFHYRHGKFPLDLSLLVKEGLLSAQTYATVRQLGWCYRLQDDGQGYSLA